jgi:DNA-3-methyladenine glycosylase
VSAVRRLLPAAFFERSPEAVAPDLLGCVLEVTADGATISGRIVETEAYLGADDAGSHAATRGITKRNAVMYGPPGHAYVYFTYGNHYMLNVVCEPEGIAGGVLIRAVEPLSGIDVMTSRRRGRPLHELCDGPGKLTQAMAIDLSDNGVALGEGRIAVYDGVRPPRGAVATSGRIGLSAGGDLELRFYLKDSTFVSRRSKAARQDRHGHATGRAAT